LCRCLQVAVGVAGLSLGYYTFLRGPAHPAPAGADQRDLKDRDSTAGKAAAAGIGAVLPGAAGALPRPPSSVVVDELDAETRRHTSGKHWQRQREHDR